MGGREGTHRERKEERGEGLYERRRKLRERNRRKSEGGSENRKRKGRGRM